MNKSAFEPKVSIVIPVYNGADFLAEAIDSALAQTYRNTEILVVNDGSNDGGATEAVALGYGDRISYFSKTNGGVASALNFAIDKMAGEYFSWLSHDDLYAVDKVDRDIAAIRAIREESRHKAVIYSNYEVFSTLPELGTSVRLEGVSSADFRYWLTIKNALHGCTLLIPRQAFAEVGRFDESLRTTQDFDLWFRMAAGFDFHHLPDNLVSARTHAEQGSIKMADKALAESDALLTKFTQGLTRDEVLRGGGGNVAVGYARIARSLWLRNFLIAAKIASSMARLEARTQPMLTKLRVLGMLAEGPIELQGRRLLRKVLSPQMRARVRARISAVGKRREAKNLERKNLKQRFSQIYRQNIFGGGISRSGEGSDLAQTALIRKAIPELFKTIGAKSVLDAPCGDWHWMRQTDLGVERYIGVDIVEELIDRNRKSFSSDTVQFACKNLVTDALPQVDVIFSRDCLVHLSLADAATILKNFKRSGSTYLLTTTFTDRSVNKDLSGKESFWRPLNLQQAPFYFPPPLALIKEECTEEHGRFADKSLGLWRLADIDLAPSSYSP